MLVSLSTMPAGEKYLEYVKQIESFADFLHLDVCDGEYNSTKCFLPEYAKIVNQNTTLPMDCHLMTKNALEYAKQYILAGVNIVSAQIESFETEKEIVEFVEYVKTHNALVGLAMEPKTEFAKILPYIDILDVVLVLAVPTGKSGQKFDEKALNKIEEINNYRLQNKLNFKIEVDGGVDDQKAKQLKTMGIDIVVSGNYVFSATDKHQAVELLR